MEYAAKVYPQEILSVRSPNAHALFYLLVYPVVLTLLGVLTILVIVAVVLCVKFWRLLQVVSFVIQVTSHYILSDE